MNDPRLVEALRAREADAVAGLYGAYADRIYAYCWFRLRERDAAQVALRDTFIVAEAHIDELRDPHRLEPWLYAIARLECGRRAPAHDDPPDVPIADHRQEDVDQRIMAWHAVMALPPSAREVLALRMRHHLPVIEVAAVMGVPVRDAQAMLDRAHGRLERALVAEILAHRGPYGCPERARLLRERNGPLSPEPAGRLAAHAEECPVCRALRPRTVSAAKVFGLLPDPVPPEELRVRVMSCFLDPELAGYRRFAATRVTAFTPDGFPVAPGPLMGRLRASLRGARRTRPATRSGCVPEYAGSRSRAVRLALVLGLAVGLLGGGLTAMYAVFGAAGQGAGSAGRVVKPGPGSASSTSPTAAGEHSVTRRNAGEGSEPMPVSATFPLGARTSSAPPEALPTPPAGRPLRSRPLFGGRVTGSLVVSPLYLDLAGGSAGSVELRAEGGPVEWRATTRGPLRVSRTSGRLGDGEAVTLGVQAVRDTRSQGEGAILFSPGGTPVCVTWRPDVPDPGPSPTPTGSTSPSPGPATDPPSSSGPPPSGEPSKPPASGTPSPSEPPEPPSSAPPSSSTPSAGNSAPPSDSAASSTPSGDSPAPETSG
ncbi:sigma-70 family RNA polymerase sigma factor [Spirillospora albida]|uniref:sigma-70 family RNA polymerase sigma factor n=1 Tax=Spirillospora albida TaxID=58123 RepID=UPI0004BFF644|nr:sigma-70 family RNA polymerase sigma factor [Spirillospora albida]